MTLILLQTKFDVLLPNDIGRDPFLVEADASHQIFAFDRNNFSPMILMDLILEFLELQ